MLLIGFSYAMDGADESEEQIIIPHRIPYQIPKDIVKSLPSEGRIEVLVILGFPRCVASTTNGNDELFCDELKKYEPALANPKDIGPTFAQKIARFKKWHVVREIFSAHELVLMTDKDYHEHVINVLECAYLIRYTPSYAWYSCGKAIKELSKNSIENYIPPTQGSGLQKAYKDPVFYVAGIFTAGVASIATKVIMGLSAQNKEKTKATEETTDALNGEFWTWLPWTQFMKQAGCGADYATKIPTNYTIFNNTVVNYPSTTESNSEFCSAMGVALKNFMNDKDHSFKPPYPVSNLDYLSFWFSCLRNLRGNITKYVSRGDNTTNLYPALDSEVPKLSHKGVFTSSCGLSIPDDFPQHPAQMEFEYTIVNTNCYVDHLMKTDNKSLFNYMYNYFEKYGLPWRVFGLVALDTALLISPILIACAM